MDAQQRNIDTLANNIANVNTTGFRESRVEFRELLYQQVRGSGDPGQGGAPSGVEVGLGVATGSTQRNFEQGTLEVTENPLDLAIEGSGFFQVMQGNGEMGYTRAGNFRINADGNLTTQDGYEVFPPINVPQDAIAVEISRDGRVAVQLPDDPAAVEIGQVELANFQNPTGLRSMGRNLFAETDASGIANTSIPGENGVGEVSQGFLEGSNVNVVEEMVNMIVAQRSYEINSKVIRTADEMLRSASNVK